MDGIEKLLKTLNQLKDENNYQRIIALTDEKTLARYNSYELFGLKAWAFVELQQYDKGINCYDRAIALNPRYAIGYSNRGSAWHKKLRFDKALSDLDTCLKIDPNRATAYYNRGVVYDELEEYDKSLEDYTKAIELVPNNFNALYNRGNNYYRRHQYDKAIEDYTHAIQVFSDDASIFTTRGLCYYAQKRYAEALSDFNQALLIDNEYERAKLWQDKVNTILGTVINSEEEKSDYSFYLFVNAVKSLSEADRLRILQEADQIMDGPVERIRHHALNTREIYVAHYTKLRVADLLVMGEESRLRYYNAVYMNDPEEGKTLLYSLDSKLITTAFEAGEMEEESNIYLGSFLPAGGGSVLHEDDLVMWRTYGKDEKLTEAGGCSVVIDVDFFDKDLGRINPGIRRRIKDDGIITSEAQTLYKVLYYDQRKKKFEGDIKGELAADIAELKRALLGLLALKDKVKKGVESAKNRAIDKIVYHIISEVRHFFKSADYAFENELRVIQFASGGSEQVLIDPAGFPKRLYIESTKSVQPYIKEIILGPKVPAPQQWIYLETAMKKKGLKMELRRSTCKFQ